MQLRPTIAVFALIALASCTGAEQVVQDTAPAEEWITLFDGTSTDGWAMSGPGAFNLLEDGTIESEGGMGLFYYKDLMLKDFVLELDWKSSSDSANSGVFVRFPDAPDPWFAVNTGYEIQIDDSQDPIHVTGSVYSFSSPFKVASNPTGEWNTYQIKVTGQRYQVYLNGEKVNDFYGDRSEEGMIGLQNHDDNSKVAFRNIRVKPLEGMEAAKSLAEHFAVTEEREPINVLMLTTTHGFRHGPAIDQSKLVMESLSQTTEFNFDITEDLSVLNSENLANYDLLFLANTTLRLQKEVASAGSAGGSMAGDWGMWDVGIKIPQGELEGMLMISGSPGDFSGGIEFTMFPGVSELMDIQLDGDELSFSWDGGPYGIIEAITNLDGENMAGTVKVDGNEMPLEGMRVAQEATDVNLTGKYDLSIEAPQGVLEAMLDLTDGDELGGTFYAGDAPLMIGDVKKEGSVLTFYFDTPEFGRIDTRAEFNGSRVSGTMNAQGSDVPFSGEKKMDDSSGEKEIEILISEAQQKAIMDFLAEGKGIVGAHSALDAFYAWDEYKEMVGGGLFESHPWTQSVDIVIEEKDNPATAHFGDSFSIVDEIYVLDENPRWNAKVLMSLDMSSVEPSGDSRGTYRNDYPISWMKEHNGGNVFFTKLGHFADVWTTPAFVQHLLQGMRMAAGRIDADFSGRMVKETIADNVWPDDLAVDDKGNVWIAELRGKVHRYDAETGETSLIAEIPTTDPKNIEHGLYGIEVDPEFYDGQPYIYAFYAERESFINTLSRFIYKDGMLDLESEEVILRVPTEPQCCHQAGDIEWGPDGTLYLSTGDTGMSETRPDWEVSEEQLDGFMKKNELEEIQWSRLADSERTSQNLQDLRGKILRINKDGSIPKDNPFYGEPGVRWEVYAYGLRNPYRFKVDPDNGYLYIGVVGPDAQFDYDEYNISQKGGENFGWPREIGRLMYNDWSPDQIPNYTPPIWEYTYETGGRSASGGPMYNYTGEGAFPPVFQGKLFVYDWARGWIKYGKLIDDTVEIEKTNGESYTINSKRLVDVKTLDILRSTRPISMELGPDGAIYVAEFTGFWDAAPGSKVTRYRWVSKKNK